MTIFYHLLAFYESSPGTIVAIVLIHKKYAFMPLLILQFFELIYCRGSGSILSLRVFTMYGNMPPLNVYFQSGIYPDIREILSYGRII